MPPQEVSNEELLQRWKSLFERYNCKTSTIVEKSQTLKDMLSEINLHLKLGRISQECYEKLHIKYTKEYAKLVKVTQENNPTKENKSPNAQLEEAIVQNSADSKNSMSSTDVGKINTYSENYDKSLPTSGVNSDPSVQKSNSTDKLSKDIGTKVSVTTGVDDEKSSAKSFSFKSTTRSFASSSTPTAAVSPMMSEASRVSGISFGAESASNKEQTNLLSLWTTARKQENADNPLSANRLEKRKHVSDSPVSKKASKAVDEAPSTSCDFLTAREQLKINELKQGRAPAQSSSPPQAAVYGNVKKSLGTRRGIAGKFVPPVQGQSRHDDKTWDTKSDPNSNPILLDERLKNCEPRMIELILNEILDNSQPMTWDDIAGLEFAKKTIQEIVVWPMLRPDIFTGLRGPPKGLLLFGPPGNGKTLFGKCIASQSKSTFFTISASSLTSKWVGEGEKMVRTLFAVARCHQPAVVFIDEIDSLLTQRSDGEHESSRRIKTEFLVQLDGACTAQDERLLVIGATNRPQEIDEAARRRFVKRLYIPLPECNARAQIVKRLLHDQKYELNDENFNSIAENTGGYSGSDMANLCREAALGPIRSIPFGEIGNISADDVRPIQFCDFEDALDHVKASVSEKDLDVYLDWNSKFGSGRR